MAVADYVFACGPLPASQNLLSKVTIYLNSLYEQMSSLHCVHNNPTVMSFLGSTFCLPSILPLSSYPTSEHGGMCFGFQLFFKLEMGKDSLNDSSCNFFPIWVDGTWNLNLVNGSGGSSMHMHAWDLGQGFKHVCSCFLQNLDIYMVLFELRLEWVVWKKAAVGD